MCALLPAMRPLVLLCGCLLLSGYGALMGPKNIRGSEGDTVSIQCTYEEKLRNHQKYWCRKTEAFFFPCSDTIYARADGQENTEGRVSIQDSPQELRFNVTLRALTLEDSGEYWCGIRRLGFDESHLVSLVILPAFPSVYPQATTAKWGKTEAKASPLTGTSPPKHTGASLYTGTSPYEETSPHKATSPHAGTSGPPTHLDSTSAKDTSLFPSSSSSKSRVYSTRIRILAPVLVLLALLLASGLCALGRHMLQWRKKVQLATETQRNEKDHHSHLTSEQEEAPFQDPDGEAVPGPPLHMSEELKRAVFVSV
ncbi:CMRF35-like molecule 9 isoform X2 [Sturnira hondurensis]|uniref:CMRF35-like molecule 9 isoform X2 n=1 Tax=Sturnira hondurensis TaxID=192404 RepID=UPI0018791623|nr:CMRF35-like molecule 9 isoform X2 [Sturnira hondurensis]